VDYLIYCFLELWYPRDKIDRCKPWPTVAPAYDGFGGEHGVEVNGELERYGTVRQRRRGRREGLEDDRLDET
jgi:phosphatidylinositol glycan class A protein